MQTVSPCNYRPALMHELQPINQTISHNQSVNHSTTQSVYHSITISITITVTQSINHTVTVSVKCDHTINHTVNHTIHYNNNQLHNRSFSDLLMPSISKSLISQAIHDKTSHAVMHTINQSFKAQSIHHTELCTQAIDHNQPIMQWWINLTLCTNCNLTLCTNCRQYFISHSNSTNTFWSCTSIIIHQLFFKKSWTSNMSMIF